MSWIKSSFIVTCATILALVVAEVALRSTNPYPARDYKSTNVRFGNILSSNHQDADIDGFRNPDSTSVDAEVVAIGDSHTYGVNVSASESWPAQLSSELNQSIRNLGIGGNGVYTYHWLVKDAIANGKKVFLGLYIPNDFQASGYFCDIDFDIKWWMNEKERLDLSIPNDDCSFNKVAHSPFNVLPDDNLLRRILKHIVFRSAFLSAAYYEIYVPFFKSSDDSDALILDNKLSAIKFDRLKTHRGYTDLSDPVIRAVYEDFLSMVEDWRSNMEKEQLNVILIPSRQVVYYEYLNNLIGDTGQAAELLPYVETQLDLGNRLQSTLERMDIAVVDATEEVAVAFEEYLKAKGKDNFYPDNGHPNQFGYGAYARAAVEVHAKGKPE